MLLVDHKNVSLRSKLVVDQLFPLCGSQGHMAAAQGYRTNNLDFSLSLSHKLKNRVSILHTEKTPLLTRSQILFFSCL